MILRDCNFIFKWALRNFGYQRVVEKGMRMWAYAKNMCYINVEKYLQKYSACRQYTFRLLKTWWDMKVEWELYEWYVSLISGSGHACMWQLKADVHEWMKTIIPVQEAASLCCQRFGRAGNLRLLWRIRAQTKKDKEDNVNCHYNRKERRNYKYTQKRGNHIFTQYLYVQRRSTEVTPKHMH